MSEPIIPQKRCAKCKRMLPATPEFFRRASKEKDGLKSSCKECLKQQDASWREKNPTHQSDWYQENKEHALNRSKAWYEEHKEEKLQYDKDRRAKNPELTKQRDKEQYEKVKADPEKWAKKLASVRQYNKDNPEIARATRRKIRAKRKDIDRIQNRERDRRNPEKARAKTHKRLALKKNAPGHYTGDDLKRIYEEQEGRCCYCAITLFWDIPYDIYIEHIQALENGGSNWPENIALACQYCNCSKSDKTLAEWMESRGW